MNDVKILKTKSFPKAMQEFAHENFNLKVLCAGLIGLALVCLVLVLYLVKQGPVVIALDNTGEVSQIETKVTDLQIQAAIRQYISYRYSWDDKSIASHLKKASFFVHPSLVSAFEKSMVEVQKFVREKKVTQRVYPKHLEVDFKEKKVTVIADRITEFDALKAATEMRLTLQFAVDSRTVVNPWGLYVTKETESASQ